jgi:hypothetical protein
MPITDGPFDKLNNISPGTRYTKNEADGNLSKGVITSLHTDIDDIDDMVKSAADKWPGTGSDLPLEKTTIIKKDGGIGIQIAEYSFKNSRTNKNNPPSATVLHSTNTSVRTVPWYDVESVLVINNHKLIDPEPPGGALTAADDKNEMYGRPIVTWTFKVPYLSNSSPWFGWISGLTNNINKEDWILKTSVNTSGNASSGSGGNSPYIGWKQPQSIQGSSLDMKFEAYTILVGGASTSTVLQDDGSVLYHGYWLFEWRRDGWKKRRRLSDGRYAEMLMYEAVSLKGLKVDTEYNPGG